MERGRVEWDLNLQVSILFACGVSPKVYKGDKVGAKVKCVQAFFRRYVTYVHK